MGASPRLGLALALALSAIAPGARADSTRTHLLPDGPTETCQLLVPFPFRPPDAEAGARTWYRDEDTAAIDRLCAIDLHADESNVATAVGVCPKIHGTLPGLEIYDLTTAGAGKRLFEATRCKIPGRQGGSAGKSRRAVKLAKFKTAVFGSENESVLFYFHFSRLLGNLAHVQPATFRTVARSHYQRWTADAITRLTGRSQPAYSPLDGWEILQRLLSPRTRPRPRIVWARKRILADDERVQGAIMENPRGERERNALCLRGSGRLGQPKMFREFAFFRLVASRRPVPGDVNLQTLACARDFTDMVILDHVFNQIDRMGNVHQKTYHHYLDDRGHLAWKGKPAPGAVPLVRLVLKDNDDGLKWKVRGAIVASRLLDDIRHLDPTVYRRMQWLASVMSDPATAPQVKAWFRDSVHVTDASYDRVRERFLEVAAHFRKLHDAGILQLDLDLEAALRAAAAQAQVSASTGL